LDKDKFKKMSHQVLNVENDLQSNRTTAKTFSGQANNQRTVLGEVSNTQRINNNAKYLGTGRHNCAVKPTFEVFNEAKPERKQLVETSGTENNEARERKRENQVLQPINEPAIEVQMSEGEDEMSDEAEIEVMEDVEHEPKAPAEREASHSEQAELGHRDYVKDIVVNLKSSERRSNKVRPTYMNRQRHITRSMRSILVDWIVEVIEEYSMSKYTLHLSVHIIDKFLSKMEVSRDRLQLLGTAATYIASKFEEIYPPDVAEFVYITDDTYEREHVLKMEKVVLKVISFELTIPHAHTFVKMFLSHLGVEDSTMKNLCLYLADLTLLSTDFLVYFPSVIATAAVCIARHTLNEPAWEPETTEFFGYELCDVKDCALKLWQFHSLISEMQYKALADQYARAERSCVSSIEPNQAYPLLVGDGIMD